MRSLVHSSLVTEQDPSDYEARSNISWVCTWALNTLISRGRSTDWEVHMTDQVIGAVTNATHGMMPSAVSLPRYRHVIPYGLAKFTRFATNAWGISWWRAIRAPSDTGRAAKQPKGLPFPRGMTALLHGILWGTRIKSAFRGPSSPITCNAHA